MNKIIDNYFNILNEAKKDPKEKEAKTPPEDDGESSEEAPDESDMVPGDDMSSDSPDDIDPGMDGDMGMMPDEEVKDPSELGRVFELKKIYNRLTTIESYLNYSSDSVLLKLRNYVSKSIELFEVLSSNIKSYQDKMDSIIVTYYKFISVIYAILKKYMAKKHEEEKVTNKKKN